MDSRQQCPMCSQVDTATLYAMFTQIDIVNEELLLVSQGEPGPRTPPLGYVLVDADRWSKITAYANSLKNGANDLAPF